MPPWGNNGGKLFQFKPITIGFASFNDCVKKFTEQELAAAYCKQYTNEQIMQALALMDYKQEDDFDKLPKYVTEFEESLKSGEPMNFYDFIKNEDDLRDYLTEEWPDENIDEYLEKYGDDYVYSPLGALFLNRLY